MYSNNGRIVDADDEYLSTSEWRFTNRLFRIEQIQQSIFPSNAKLLFERIGFCEYPNNPNNLITGYTPYWGLHHVSPHAVRANGSIACVVPLLKMGSGFVRTGNVAAGGSTSSSV